MSQRPARRDRNVVIPISFVLVTLGSLSVASWERVAAEQADGAPKTRPSDLAKQILATANVSGGLIVHVGCADGKLTRALAESGNYLVHGLAFPASDLRTARKTLQSSVRADSITVDSFDGRHLPYIDNLVNLLIVNERSDLAPVSAEGPGGVPLDEIMRVLAPRGVALIPESLPGRTQTVRIGDTIWQRLVKPSPSAIDEWTHFLHGPDNNAVAHDDVVSLPFRIQWVGGPKWARHHNHLSSTSAVVTSAGRLFAIIDEGPTASLMLPPEWRLVARDAFNGVVLWKKPIDRWEGVLRPFRSGPTEMGRRLVAVGDRVYVTLGYGQPVSELDAATGELIRRHESTRGALEIVRAEDVLYVVAGTLDEQAYRETARRGMPSPAATRRRIVAIAAPSGNVLWSKSDAETQQILPTTLCVEGQRLFFQNPDQLVCLEARSGQPVWRADRPVRRDRLGWSTPTVVAHDAVVFSADCGVPEKNVGPVRWKPTAAPKRGDAGSGEVIAFSTSDGHELWRAPAAQGYNAPVDVFIADGLLWVSVTPGRNELDFTEARDLLTGEIKRRIDPSHAFESAHHHRCYRDKATDRFLLLGRTGVEFVDLTGKDKAFRNCWTRGACQYGVMPANGLLYCPPHSCACYIQSKLSGFWAMAGEETRDQSPESRAQDRLERGPAYERANSNRSDTLSLSADTRRTNPGTQPSTLDPRPSSTDWPTHRHDIARTGATKTSVGTRLRAVWRTQLQAPLTSPVVANGVLLTASTDAHVIHALNADTGALLWSFTASGRVDSPPTIDGGRAIWGCADGYVYCVRLEDGELIWRFLAAPADRRTVAFGQLESVWPVTGSVLIRRGIVYATAGRSSYLDGGMILWRLDAKTGKVLGQRRFDDRDPKTGREPDDRIEDVELPGSLPDVLVCDGNSLYLRDRRLTFDGHDQPLGPAHIYCSAGLLDDTWWHRTYWQWGERAWGRASGWRVASLYRPSGHLLVADESTVFGYGRATVASSGNSLAGCHLFRADKKVQVLNRKIRNNNKALEMYQKPAKVMYHWSHEVPIAVRGLVLANDVLFAAGPKLQPEGPEPDFARPSPSAVMAVHAEDGQEIAHVPLNAQPVFDGLIAAAGRLYVSLNDGSLACLGE